MIKVIAILFLLYFFFRSIGFIVRMFLGSGNTNSGMFGQGSRPAQRPAPKTRPKGSNLNVDQPNQQKNKDYDGGEYIEYEEVD
jgi:hypothetical protein